MNINLTMNQSLLLLSCCVQIFATLWTAAWQASLSFTISLNLLKFVSIDSMMPSNHFILCHHLFFLLSILPASGSFPVSELFTSGGQSIGASASASVLPMNIQAWFPLGLIGLISLLSKGLSRVFSSITVWKHQFFVLCYISLCYIKHIYLPPKAYPYSLFFQ